MQVPMTGKSANSVDSNGKRSRSPELTSAGVRSLTAHKLVLALSISHEEDYRHKKKADDKDRRPCFLTTQYEDSPFASEVWSSRTAD